MKRRIFILILFILCCSGCYQIQRHPLWGSTPVAVSPAPRHKLLLIPLDSRPPCRQFVIEAGKISQTEVLTPPPAALDYYTRAGNTQASRRWLKENIQSADTLILSIDQLLYGGLLNAREKEKSPAEINDLLNFLTTLHKENPNVKIYAFNVLPRLTPPPSIEGYKERKALMCYSRLVDKVALYHRPEDQAELREILAKISPASLARYQSLYKTNTELNKKLSHMAKEGILTRLIIGQDDGEEFGIPNMEKRQIRQYLNEQKISEKKVYLTHGADEIGLTLLTEVVENQQAFHPKIYVAYNDAATPGLIMPYMASSVADTTAEKIWMLQGTAVADPEKADLLLYVSCGTNKNLSQRMTSVRRLEQLAELGKPLALVDLSEHFSAEETLFPLLLKSSLPLESLAAYAGWNTTSNSLGTALSQAVLFTAESRHAATEADILRLYQNQIAFLNNRYVEDFYYLKDVISLVDTSLKKAGYQNVSDLDTSRNYLWANKMMQQALLERLDGLKQSSAIRHPFTVSTPQGPIDISVQDITAEISYPWPRTFEIDLRTTPLLYMKKR